MFRRLSDEHITPAPEVSIVIDGKPCTAREGDSVAAAMLASGHAAFRTTATTGSARGPYCMLGTCFDCMVVVDGRQSQQACLTPVRDGMTIESQQGARSVRSEVTR